MRKIYSLLDVLWLAALSVVVFVVVSRGPRRLMAGTPAPAAITARNQVPVQSATAGVWTLPYFPLAGVACYRNGLRQAPGIDYTIASRNITSKYWEAGDALLCDFEHS
jgi:hypothetical protein